MTEKKQGSIFEGRLKEGHSANRCEPQGAGIEKRCFGDTERRGPGRTEPDQYFWFHTDGARWKIGLRRHVEEEN